MKSLHIHGVLDFPNRIHYKLGKSKLQYPILDFPNFFNGG